MQIVNGKTVRHVGAAEIAAWAAEYRELTLDLGTGDGRFVGRLAERCPEAGAIGVDLCAANLRAAARTAPANARFVVADALALPEELAGVATRIVVAFPWGSLLRGLVAGHPGLLAGLAMAGRPGAAVEIEVILNAGALAEAGCPFAAGGERVAATLRAAGFRPGRPQALGPADLRQAAVATTWAKRLAFGRDPRAIRLAGALHQQTVGPIKNQLGSPAVGMEGRTLAATLDWRWPTAPPGGGRRDRS